MGQNMRQDRKPVIIDFLGLPGSGKSTLSHLVADQLRTKGIPVREPTYELDHRQNVSVRKLLKLLQVIKHFIYSPVNSLKAIFLILRSGQRHRKEAVKLAINLLYISECCRKCRRDKGVFMFDQGFFQAVCSILFSATYRSDFEKKAVSLFERLLSDSGYVLIHVVTDQATAIARMEQRSSNYSRLEKLEDQTEMRRQLSGFYRCLSDTEELAHRWNRTTKCRSGDLNVIRVDNGNGSSLTNNQMILAGRMEMIIDHYTKKQSSSSIKIHNG